MKCSDCGKKINKGFEFEPQGHRCLDCNIEMVRLESKAKSLRVFREALMNMPQLEGRRVAKYKKEMGRYLRHLEELLRVIE